MAPVDGWDAQKMLDLYLLDYLIKNGMHETAEIFKIETGVSTNPCVINAPKGFLHEWWSIFYDTYNNNQTKFTEERVQQAMESQQQTMRPATQQLQMNQPQKRQFLVNPEPNRMLGQPGPNQLAAMNYEKEQFRPLHGEHDLGFRYVSSNSSAASPSSQQQQLCYQSPQPTLRDNRHGFSFGPSFWAMQEGISPVTNSQGAAMSRGINSAQPMGRAVDTVRKPDINGIASAFGLEYDSYNFGHQGGKAPMQTQHNQWQFDTQQRPGLLAEGLSCMPRHYTCASPGSSSKLVHQIPSLPNNNASRKNVQAQVKNRTLDQTRQHTERNQESDQLQVEPLPEDHRRRKKKSDSKPEGKSLDCMKNTQQVKPAEENVESYLSNDDRDADGKSPPFSILRNGSAPSEKDEHKAFSFEEVGCLLSSKSKILCSHFSSDGKLLASAGQEKKVLIWNTQTFDFFSISEGHSALITDVRFRPNSNIFATSSFNRAIQIWDADQPSKPLLKLLGHCEHVMSLDFHPRKTDLLCSCDSNNEIRYWNVSDSAFARISKGATKQVRFQPGLGQVLATATGNHLNLIDVEKDAILISLEGHEKDIQSISWDPSGKHVVSVSEDRARVWSAVTGGECMHELLSHGNKFQACAFHPAYSQCLIIGGYQTIELWNPAESNRTLAVQAHKGLVSSLSNSQETGLVASTSHDQCVKLWK